MRANVAQIYYLAICGWILLVHAAVVPLTCSSSCTALMFTNAVMALNPGDTLAVSGGPYVGGCVTIAGPTPAGIILTGTSIIDCDNDLDGNLFDHVGGDLIVSGLTFQNVPGIVFHMPSVGTFTFASVTFKSMEIPPYYYSTSTVYYYGAITLETKGKLNVTDSVFNGVDGAIYSRNNASVFIQRCQFTNTVFTDHVIRLYAGSNIILDSQFVGLKTYSNGGAVSQRETADGHTQGRILVDNCYFHDVHGSAYGITVAVRHSSATISRSIFFDNYGISYTSFLLCPHVAINSVYVDGNCVIGASYTYESTPYSGRCYNGRFIASRQSHLAVFNSTFKNLENFPNHNSIYTYSATSTSSGEYEGCDVGEGGVISGCRPSGNWSIIDSHFLGNFGQFGGTLAMQVTDRYFVVNVDRSVFRGNSASSNGGAILVGGLGLLNISNSIFEENSGADGGAVHVAEAGLNTVNCAFRRNIARDLGGALSFFGARAYHLRDLVISECISLRGGGGLRIGYNGFLPLVTLENILFSGCSTRAAGMVNGGSIIMLSGILDMYNTTIENSSSTSLGGAIYSGGLSASLGVEINMYGSTIRNSTTGSQGGAVFLHGVLYTEECNFIGNQAGQGGALWLPSDGQYTGVNTTFVGNSAFTGTGGAISTIIATVWLWSCSFFNNFAATEGGAIYATSGSIHAPGAFEFAFVAPRCNLAGGFGMVCINNTAALHGGCMFVTEMDGCIARSTISQNSAGNGGGVMILYNVAMEIFESEFAENTVSASGAAIYSASPLHARLNLFHDNKALGVGGGIFIDTTSEVPSSLANITWSRNTASSGGGLYLSSPAFLSISHWDNNVAESGAAIFISDGFLNMNNSEFTANTARSTHSGGGGAVFVSGIASVLLASASLFLNNTARAQGGALAWSAGEIYLTALTFIHNIAGQVGGALAYCPLGDATGRLAVEDSSFIGNSAARGGAYFGQLAGLSIGDSAFVANVANDGGALRLIFNGEFVTNDVLVNVSFISNEAIRGAAIFFDASVCNTSLGSILNEHGNTFVGNVETAGGYGSKAATDVAVLTIELNGTSLSGTEAIVRQSGDNLGGTVDAITVLAIDCLGNLVTTPSNFISLSAAGLGPNQAAVGINNNLGETGTTGIASFPLATLVAPVEGQYVFTASMSAHGLQSARIPINVTACREGTAIQDGVCHVLPCPAGSATAPAGSVVDCIICEAGTFTSFSGQDSCRACQDNTYSDINATACIPCPAGATCDSGLKRPLPGYWYNAALNAFVPCPGGASACPGQDGSCPMGYTNDSYACSMCDEEHDYAPVSPGKCARCLPVGGTIVIFIITMLLIIGVGVRLVRNVGNDARESAIVYKILLNFLQLSALASSFESTSATTLAQAFSYSTASSVSVNAFPAACLFHTTTYGSLITTIIIPVVLVPLIVGFFYAFNCLFSHRMDSPRHWSIVSVVVLLFIMYPNLTSASLTMFQCREIDGRLAADVNVVCYEGSHRAYAIVAGVALVVYGAGIPAGFLFILVRNRNRLVLKEVASRYNVLYKGFKHDYYGWELLIMMRKLITVVILVFAGGSGNTQAILGLALLIICTVLQVRFHPFNLPKHNMLETGSLIVSTFTILLGLFFSTDVLPASSIGADAMVIFLLIINAIFVAVCLYALISSGIAEQVQQRLHPRGYCKGCFIKSVKDIALEETDVSSLSQSVDRTSQTTASSSVSMDSVSEDGERTPATKMPAVDGERRKRRVRVKVPLRE